MRLRRHRRRRVAGGPARRAGSRHRHRAPRARATAAARLLLFAQLVVAGPRPLAENPPLRAVRFSSLSRPIVVTRGRLEFGRPLHIPSDTFAPRPRLSIIVPCYNERSTVQTIISKVTALNIDKEVIVVDNHSTDGTRAVLRSLCRNERPLHTLRGDPALRRFDATVMDGDGFTLVMQPENRGKGASVRLGLELARGEYVICQDADLEYEPADIVRLLRRA